MEEDRERTMRDREIECFLHDVVRSLSLTRLSRSSPGLIPPLVTLAAQREGREPTGRTRSESGREVSDRHAERRGGRRECKTEPHVVPLSLRFGSLRPLVLRVFRRHFIPPVFIILRFSSRSVIPRLRSSSRHSVRPAKRRLRRVRSVERRREEAAGRGRTTDDQGSGSFIVLHSSLYTYAAQPGAVRRYTTRKGNEGTV